MSFGPQHDFRASPDTRRGDAVDFLEEELPGARITVDPIDERAEYYMLVIEECDRSSDLIDSLAGSLDKVVSTVKGVDHYDDGAEIYFYA